MNNKISRTPSKAARHGQLAELQRAQRRDERRRRLLILGVPALLAVVILAIVVVQVAGRRNPSDITGLQKISGLTNPHTDQPVRYPQTPPAGGPHNPVWLNCGIYNQPVRNENAVHSLEHGAVWITYQPDLAANQVAALRRIVGTNAKESLSPYPDLPAPIVVSAWARQLQLTSADDPRLPQFLRALRNGAQAPEPAGPCTGGTGTPTG